MCSSDLASAEELGRVFVADLPINAGPGEFAAAARKLTPLKPPAWSALTKAARADYVENLQPGSSPGALDMNAVMRELAKRLPKDAIMVTDAGNFSGWVQRYWQHSTFHSLVAPTSGAMGYGVAAAVGAAATAPTRQVVCFVGDGGFLMSGQELATAKQYGLKPLIILVNNSLYGTIRMHQERDFPGRSIANALENPDFAAYARAFGCFGEIGRASCRERV